VIGERITESSWIWKWSAHGGMHEIAFMHQIPKWVVRFRVPPGGWTEDQEVELELPVNQEIARRIARDYILEHGGEQGNAKT
jgi:hypothetical protein